MKKSVVILKADEVRKDGSMYTLFMLEEIKRKFESGLIEFSCDGYKVGRVWIDGKCLIGEFDEPVLCS